MLPTSHLTPLQPPPSLILPPCCSLAAIKTLEDNANQAKQSHASVHAKAERMRAQAAEVQRLAETTKRAEEAGEELEKASKGAVGAQLGIVLKKKGMKVGDIVAKWGGQDGFVDKGEVSCASVSTHPLTSHPTSLPPPTISLVHPSPMHERYPASVSNHATSPLFKHTASPLPSLPTRCSASVSTPRAQRSTSSSRLWTTTAVRSIRATNPRLACSGCSLLAAMLIAAGLLAAGLLAVMLARSSC